MGDMTLSTFQSRVLLALGNLSTDHPVISAGMHTTAINDAANDLIRAYPEKFPEHCDNSWTIGPTTVGENKVSVPSNMLVLEALTRPDDDEATTDPAGWEDTNEIPISHDKSRTIGLLPKESTDTGYPQLYDRKGTYIIYHPPTRTGYTTYLRAYGLAGEARLSAAADTFRIHDDFSEAVILLAASKVAMWIGRAKRAGELEIAAQRKMTGGLTVIDREADDDQAIEGFSFSSGGCY